jgi:hypothetical protein
METEAHKIAGILLEKPVQNHEDNSYSFDKSYHAWETLNLSLTKCIARVNTCNLNTVICILSEKPAEIHLLFRIIVTVFNGS